MRKRRDKLSLTFSGGVNVSDMTALREHFDLKACAEYLQNGKLAEWLSDRLYDDEAAAVRAINADDKNWAQELCKIFGVDYDLVSEQLDDEETIAWRRERRERLKKFTSDATILKRVDDVAFDQDDLIDILREENIPSTIYLCDGNFIFPSGALKKQNITYVGVSDNVSVKIDTLNSFDSFDLEALGIIFKNVNINGFKTFHPAKSNTAATVQKNSGDNRFEGTVVYPKYGISLPNANKIVKTAREFHSSITLFVGSTGVNAKNPAFVNQLKLSKGVRIRVLADGTDAQKAVETLIILIDKSLD